jgi:hypothetical protein
MSVTMVTVALPPERRTTIACDVHVWTPLAGDARDRLHGALHAADRRLGVIVGGSGGGTKFTLLTWERDERPAHAYAQAVLREAARRAGISDDELARATITQIVSRRRNLTGRPRRVEAPPGRYRAVDMGDRGRLRALHEGPLGEWIVYLEPDRGRAWAGRDLLAVLSELWELPHGRKDTWVYDVIETLAGRNTPLGIRYACPCCDFLTLTEPPSGTFASCPVCRWEDDNVQFRDLDYAGGANRPSLHQARTTFQRLGVSEPRRLEHARSPLPEEHP